MFSSNGAYDNHTECKKIFKSKPAIEGAGVHLKRAFGNDQVPFDFRQADWGAGSLV